jgi:hypothetical protein
MCLLPRKTHIGRGFEPLLTPSSRHPSVPWRCLSHGVVQLHFPIFNGGELTSRTPNLAVTTGVQSQLPANLAELSKTIWFYSRGTISLTSILNPLTYLSEIALQNRVLEPKTGCEGWTRTTDPKIMSLMLYQLSYAVIVNFIT